MTKLLTTITPLCFSVAANADIYHCQPFTGIGLGNYYDRTFFFQQLPLSPLEEYETKAANAFTIDTEKGVRTYGYLAPDEYFGSCSSQPATSYRGLTVKRVPEGAVLITCTTGSLTGKTEWGGISGLNTYSLLDNNAGEITFNKVMNNPQTAFVYVEVGDCIKF